MKRLFLPLLLVFCWALSAAVAEEHPNQIRETVRGAELGDPVRQYRLGMWNFWALPQMRDFPAALFWFCQSAIRDYGPAQTHLGLMYWTGNGVHRNYLQAYMWFHLAAAHGGQAAADHRDRVGRDHLSPDQIEMAKNLALSWHTAPDCPFQVP